MHPRSIISSYLNQAAGKSEKKAAGVKYFFQKLRF